MLKNKNQFMLFNYFHIVYFINKVIETVKLNTKTYINQQS